MPGSRPSTAFGPAGAASNSSCRLRPKILIASASAASRSCVNSSVLICRCALHAPGPVADVGQPFVGAAAAVFDAEMRGDHRDAGMRHGGASISSPRPSSIVSTPRLSTAEQRERAMRRDGADGFGIGVVVAEFLFLGRLLAFHHLGRDDALLPQARAQFRRADRRSRRNARIRISRAPSSAALASGTLMASRLR